MDILNVLRSRCCLSLNILVPKGGEIESYTSHYITLQGVSMFFSLLFWYYTYPELNEFQHNSFALFPSYCDNFIILSQVNQIIIMIDYYYLHIESMFKGVKMIIREI